VKGCQETLKLNGRYPECIGLLVHVKYEFEIYVNQDCYTGKWYCTAWITSEAILIGYSSISLPDRLENAHSMYHNIYNKQFGFVEI